MSWFPFLGNACWKKIHRTKYSTLLTLCTHAQRGLLYLVVCPSVCLSVGYHVFCDYVQQNSDTNGFIARLTKYYCVQKLWREKQVNKPICKLAQAYLDRVGLLCVP